MAEWAETCSKTFNNESESEHSCTGDDESYNSLLHFLWMVLDAAWGTEFSGRCMVLGQAGLLATC
jgi:hypothetical protein